MPQLDITTYNSIVTLLFGLFMIYSSLIYVAVSYSFHKAASSYYFKFYILVSALLILRSVAEVRESENTNRNNTQTLTNKGEFCIVNLNTCKNLTK